MVSWGPLFRYRPLRFLLTGKTCSSSTPSYSVGRYCRLSIEVLRLRPEDDEEKEPDLSRGLGAPSEGGGDLACSLRNARNSAGAISGCTLAGTQKRWKGSSVSVFEGESVVFDVSLVLLPSVDELSDGEPRVEPGLKGCEGDGGPKRDGVEDGLGRSGSMVSAPGVMERRRMSRRASTSRWMSYSEGWRAMRKRMGRVAATDSGRERGGRMKRPAWGKRENDILLIFTFYA